MVLCNIVIKIIVLQTIDHTDREDSYRSCNKKNYNKCSTIILFHGG
jgi:hypothetical protein